MKMTSKSRVDWEKERFVSLLSCFLSNFQIETFGKLWCKPDLPAFYFWQFAFLAQLLLVLFFMQFPASYHSKCSFNSQKSLMCLHRQHSLTFPSCCESTIMSVCFSLRTSNSTSSLSSFPLISKSRDAKAYFFFNGIFTTKNVPEEPFHCFCLMLKILFLDKLNISFELCTQRMWCVPLLPEQC